MQLVELYEIYKEENKNYIEWIEELVETDFAGYKPEEISLRLETTRIKFQELMEQSNELEVTAEEEANYKDLRYLLMDALFLASDLAHFYKCEEVGRFQMRVINNYNKRTRAQMYGHAGSGCRVM